MQCSLTRHQKETTRMRMNKRDWVLAGASIILIIALGWMDLTIISNTRQDLTRCAARGGEFDRGTCYKPRVIIYKEKGFW